MREIHTANTSLNSNLIGDKSVNYIDVKIIETRKTDYYIGQKSLTF